MSKRDDRLLLMDMLEAAERIVKYTVDIDYDTFLQNEMVTDAVTRNFEIIGEAANRVGDDFKVGNPQIEWLRITGFRNRIIHEYFGIDYEIMWDIIENGVEDLIIKLKELLN